MTDELRAALGGGGGGLQMARVSATDSRGGQMRTPLLLLLAGAGLRDGRTVVMVRMGRRDFLPPRTPRRLRAMPSLCTSVVTTLGGRVARRGQRS